MEDDPFGSLIKRCLPTSSQEEELQFCPFARQSEFFPESQPSPSLESNETQVDPTGIFMVSLPDSSKDESTPHEEENFQTPPEQIPSMHTSSGEQGPIITAVDPQVDHKIDGRGDGETMAVDDDCTDAERTVNLGTDYNNLGLLEPKQIAGIDGGDTVLVNDFCGSEVFGGEPKEFRVLQGELSGSESKRCRVSEVNLGSGTANVCGTHKEPMMIETDSNKIGDTEVIELECEEMICEGLRLDEDTVYVEMPMKENEEGVRVKKSDVVCGTGEHTAGKNIEDLEKFKYVASIRDDRRGKEKGIVGRRELPFSIRAQEKNVGGELVSSAKNQLLKDLLDALQMVSEEVDEGYEDMDLLETAKRCGLTFPRPRWWPPEGFDDS